MSADTTRNTMGLETILEFTHVVIYSVAIVVHVTLLPATIGQQNTAQLLQLQRLRRCCRRRRLFSVSSIRGL